MDTSIAEKIIQAAKGKLDACEVCLVASESKETKFASNKLKSSEGKGSLCAAIRGFKNGKMGFYSTSDLSSPEKIVDATAQLAGVGGTHEIELPSNFGDLSVEMYDPKVAALTPTDLVAMGRELIGMVQAYDPKYLNETESTVDIEDVFLINSRGGTGGYKRSMVVSVISPSIADESGFLDVYEYDFSTALPEIGFSHIAKRAIDKLKYCEKDASASTGQYEILLMPKSTAIFSPLFLAINARAVLKGYSPWKDKIGETVVDKRFEMIDNPLAKGHVSSQPFDDEGTKSKTKYITRDGQLQVFINDLYSATKLGLEPTGNAFRQGGSSEPRAGASTLIVTEGKRGFDELVASMKNGIIVDQTMGAHQSSPFSGEFNVNLSLGWLVRDGEILGRVKDCMLSGNIFGWLKDNLVEVGKGSEKPSESLCIPPLLFSGGSITAG